MSFGIYFNDYKVAGGFSPFTDTYTVGTATITAPVGATSVTITLDGGGAPGGASESGGANAGGGGSGRGGRVVHTISVTGGVTQFTYVIAAAVSGNPTDSTNTTNGNATTVTGGATLTANGGNHGANHLDDSAGTGGTGGTASGGNVSNVTGTSGSNHVGNTGGIGGGGAAAGVDGVNPADGGGGGSKTLSSGGGARGNGTFAWS